MAKRLTEITDEEWIRYHWIDVTTMRDSERRFLQGKERTPAEARDATREIRDMRAPSEP